GWPPAGPSPVVPMPPPPASDAAGDHRRLLVRYLSVCAALLAVLVVVAVYAAFFADDSSSTYTASENPTTSEAVPTTAAESNGWGDAPTDSSTDPATEAPPPAEIDEVVDGSLAFTVHGIEVGTTVVSADVPVEKTAAGEYVVVHMTVTNIGDAPVTFLGTFQKLRADGTVYSIDDEATFYTGGSLAELNPGDQADVSVTFDVPTGSTPESIRLHADPISPGVEVAFP
ncbi:MAG: DUF4352 domain-containing protein, partial [Mycobacterium sp.]|nr:DUF4352 domain-containing protein [Mycobacterium sp.]